MGVVSDGSLPNFSEPLVSDLQNKIMRTALEIWAHYMTECTSFLIAVLLLFSSVSLPYYPSFLSIYK